MLDKLLLVVTRKCKAPVAVATVTVDILKFRVGAIRVVERSLRTEETLHDHSVRHTGIRVEIFGREDVDFDFGSHDLPHQFIAVDSFSQMVLYVEIL